jgi:hypothetical protein
MDFSDVRFLSRNGLLVCPSPCNGESWGGYLLRLSVRNGYRGIRDLAGFLGLHAVSLLKAEPTTTLAKLGIEWAPKSAPVLRLQDGSRRRKVKLLYAGRSLTFRFCPQCLAEDKTPHIRSGWDGPISLACEDHDVALVAKCTLCGLVPSYHQRSHLACPCGAAYASQRSVPVPGYVTAVLSIFSEARVEIRDTFAGSTELERDASAIAHWLLEPLAAETGQRKRKVSCKYKALDLNTAATLSSHLSDWPRRAVNLIRMEYDMTGPAATWFLKRRLSVDRFEKMNRLVRALEESVVQEQELWHEENRLTLIDPRRASFGLRDLNALTGIDYQQLLKLCVRGVIPESRQGGVKVGRYFGVEVPAHVYRSIAKAYQETNSSKDAALQVGCQVDAVLGLIKAGCIRSYALTPSMVHRRTCPRDLAKFATYLFRHSVKGDDIAVTERVRFSDWVDGPYSHLSAKKWMKILVAVRAKKVTLYSTVTRPVALDELFLTRQGLRLVLNPRKARSCSSVTENR